MSSDRFELPFLSLMKKYHDEIDRLVYAAEINCTNLVGTRCNMKTPHMAAEICPFRKGADCSLEELRRVVGDHVIQHDPMVVNK